MGNNCSCLRTDSELTDFWKTLKIRTTSVKDWVETVRSKQEKTNENSISAANWQTIIKNNISNSSSDNFAKDIFDKAINEPEAKLNQGLLIISMIFLCKKESDAKVFKQKLSEFSNDYGFNNYFSIEGEKHLIKKDLLSKIVSSHVNLISLQGVDAIFKEKQTIGDSLKKVYAKEIQTKLINELFKDNKDEFVSLDTFFSSIYPKLVDDEAIREHLWNIHDNLEKEKAASEAKANAEKHVKDELDKKAAEEKKKIEETASTLQNKLSGIAEKGNLIKESGKEIGNTIKKEIETNSKNLKK